MTKILKITIFTFFILVMNTTLSAQESDSSPNMSGITHEIGINATFFIQQFISLGSSTNVNTSPYAITYRRIKSSRGIFRAGFGLSGSNTTTDISQSGSSSTSHFFIIDTRFGIERQFSLGKRWSTSLGGDIRSNFQQTKTENLQFQGTFTALDQIVTNGIGPVLGIRFDINEKIGLYTETAFLASIAVDKSNTDFGQGGNDESKRTIFSTDFSLPTSIYFTIKFNK